MKKHVYPGLRFGSLTALEPQTVKRRNGTNAKAWICRCDCGAVKSYLENNIKYGSLASCRQCCFARIGAALKKPHRDHRVYAVYKTMKARCSNPNNNSYDRYGAKGIQVCERWLESFDNFLEDMGFPKDGEEIDRIDGRKGYSPENCRWIAASEQSKNRSCVQLFEIDGENLSMADIARKSGVEYHTVKARIRRYGLSAEDAGSAEDMRRKRNYQTPKGNFSSLQEVASAFNMSLSGVCSRFKSSAFPDWLSSKLT